MVCRALIIGKGFTTQALRLQEHETSEEGVLLVEMVPMKAFLYSSTPVDLDNALYLGGSPLPSGALRTHHTRITPMHSLAFGKTEPAVWLISKYFSSEYFLEKKDFFEAASRAAGSILCRR